MLWRNSLFREGEGDGNGGGRNWELEFTSVSVVMPTAVWVELLNNTKYSN